MEKAILNLAKDPGGNQRFTFREFEPFEQLERIADWKTHVLRQCPVLHAHGKALGPQPKSMACAAFAQGAVRLEIPLHDPRPLLVAPPEIGNDALEVFAEGGAVTV